MKAKPFSQKLRIMEICGDRRGFSLLELLAVTAVIGLLATISVPALSAMKSSSEMNKAIIESSQAFEYARTVAMSQRTYVRVGIGQLTASGAGATPAIALIVIGSVDGTLDADSISGMGDTSHWRLLMKPVVMSNLSFGRGLNVERTQDASHYTTPDKTDIPRPVSFRVADRGSVVCDSFVQFNPNGEARVLRDEPARFIDIALDRATAPLGRNPFVLRVSGLNGTVSILRKGSGIQ